MYIGRYDIMRQFNIQNLPLSFSFHEIIVPDKINLFIIAIFDEIHII